MYKMKKYILLFNKVYETKGANKFKLFHTTFMKLACIVVFNVN